MWCQIAIDCGNMRLYTALGWLCLACTSFRFFFHYPLTTVEEATAIIWNNFQGLPCPQNFTHYRLTNGSHVYSIQVRTDYKGRVRLHRCTLSDLPHYSLIPWDKLQRMNYSQTLLVHEACEIMDYDLRTSHLLDRVNTDVKPSASERSMHTILHGIYPGTKWCGMGNIADDLYHELGEHSETDACCRAHDLCRPVIDAFSSRFNLYNPTIFTMTHCYCDVQLFNCFKDVNSPISKEIGRLFFNLAKVRCYDFEEKEVCTSGFLGVCFSKGHKCAAVVKDNPMFVD